MIFCSVHAAGDPKISIKTIYVAMSGEVIIIPWGTDNTVYDNTLTSEWILERGRYATTSTLPLPYFNIIATDKQWGRRDKTTR